MTRTMRPAKASAMMFVCFATLWTPAARAQVGVEKSVANHLQDGDEYTLPLGKLLDHGRSLFLAHWTIQEGAGRPLTKGTGAPLSDNTAPLVFPRNMNRLSSPEGNSCAGCHNSPLPGGGGDFVTNVFVLAHRFDFATFDGNDGINTKGALDEAGNPTLLQTIADSRNTLGMFGSGYIEMLARQMTVDLRQQRDALAPGDDVELTSCGLSFGMLSRDVGGDYDASQVVGLPPPSVAGNPPSLLILPFHQVGAAVSLRQFTNNAFNHHHGIQTAERFGAGLDPDGDGVVDELTRADVTAITVFQATLPVPGRVIPRDDVIEEAVRLGEDTFVAIGCSDCHVPALPLFDGGERFSEPNPFNPVGNLQVGDLNTPLFVDLNGKKLPRPRLKQDEGVTWVPAFTDLRLHDITTGPGDPNREALDMHAPAGSPDFIAGNGRFLTRKLWGAANEPPYFHHGQYSTMREAIEAHAGEAAAQASAWDALASAEQDAVIEFLKTLQVLPAGTKHMVVDERGKKRKWRDFPYDFSQQL